jgi:aminoglycoside phosphotransferase (APT) family kinase protein
MSAKHPWEQGPKLSQADVKQLLDLNFPNFRINGVESLGNGWDNTTWLINQKWVFRFPKHEEAAKLLLNEIKTLPNIQHLPVSIPQPELICLEPDNYPFPIYAHSYISGTSIDRANLSSTQREQLAEPLGKLLKQLHEFPLDNAKKIGISVDSIERSNVKKRVEAIKTSFNYLKHNGQVDNADMFIRIFEESQNLPVPKKLVLGHGDLYAKHILLDGNQNLSAIIDWGDCELMSPAIDLRMVYQLLPSSSHPAFWQAYGDTDSATKQLSKILSIYSASGISWYAHQVNDASLLNEGLKGLKLIEECL